MGWQLHENLSFCRVGDSFLFLDVGMDRYFRLPESQETGFASLVDGNHTDQANIRRLIDQHVLVEVKDSHPIPKPPSITTVTRSVVEEEATSVAPGITAFVETLALTYATSRQLKRNRLKTVLDRTASHRKHRIACASPSVMKRRPLDAHGASQMFLRARAYFPIDTICLLDSLSMLKFLANRGIYADLVFGVAADPFSAHCWLQSGDLVLNDTVGNVHAHTPIWIL